jgi:hypothetical protein
MPNQSSNPEGKPLQHPDTESKPLHAGAHNPQHSAYLDTQQTAHAANDMRGGGNESRHHKSKQGKRKTKRQQGGNDALTKNIEATTNLSNQASADSVNDEQASADSVEQTAGSRKRKRVSRSNRKRKRVSRSNRKCKRVSRSNRKHKRVSRKKCFKKNNCRVRKTYKGGSRNKNGGYPAHNWGCYS